MAESLLDHVRNAGFPYIGEVVHLFVGGSALHGAKVEGYDDLDIYGVFVEPPEKILGLDSYEHFVWSTAGSERKNTQNDVDICLYSLRRWAELACKGNPSVLHFLFAPNYFDQGHDYDSGTPDTWFHAARKYRGAFLCRNHAKSFLGYADAQLKRMTGERSRNCNRPDLVAKYGFDTKFAMHLIRVLSECEELMNTGVITLPSPEKDLLIGIRTGQKTEDWVTREATRRFEVCKEAATESPLPENVDRVFVSRIIADAYRQHWQKWRL